MCETREGVFKKVEDLSGLLSKAHGGHTTPRVDVEKILGELDGVRREAWTKQVDARFKLRDTLTRALLPSPLRCMRD